LRTILSFGSAIVTALIVMLASGCVGLTCPHGEYTIKGADGFQEPHCIAPGAPATPTPGATA